MIDTGPAENRLDDAEAVNAIPLSDLYIIVADSLPSKRYCVRSEFPVGRRLRRSNELSGSMLAASIALRFQAHDWAAAWPVGPRYRAGARGNQPPPIRFSDPPCHQSRGRAGGVCRHRLLARNVTQGNAEERMRPNTQAIVAAKPNGPPGTNAGAKFKSRREVHPKGGETEHVTIEQPTGL